MEKQTSRYRWIVFTTVLLTYCFIVSQRTAPGLITDHLMSTFHVTASAIGLLASVQFLAYACLQVPIGVLSDRFGPNLFLISGTLLNGIGTVIYSLSPNESIMMMARLLVGIGDATIWVNLVLILSQWFKVQEFVSLLGFAGMSGSAGFLLATVPFSAWIALSGWRLPFFSIGIILCLCGILLYFILIKLPKRFIKAPSDSHSNSDKMPYEHEKTGKLLYRMIRERQAWATFLCHFGLVGTYVGFIGSWAIPYGMHIYGMSRSSASQFVMIGLFGAIIGAPLTSWLSNKLGSIKRPYLIVHCVVFLSWLCFFLMNGKPPFFLFILLFLVIGYGNGASALTFAVVRHSFHIKEVGVISGFANTGGFLSAVLLPSVFGKVLDAFPEASKSGYHYSFLIPIVFSLLGLIGGILIKERRQLNQKQLSA